MINIIEGKGDLLGGGATALVKRVQSGRLTESHRRQEMAIEAQIYERLGVHPCLIQLKQRDFIEHALTLEYMPNGNLKENIQKHAHETLPSQRQQGAIEATEGVGLLHLHNIVQGDVGPHNSQQSVQ